MSESLYRFYRPAGPNERRVIIRQNLGFYGSLVIGGVYTLNRSRLQSQAQDQSAPTPQSQLQQQQQDNSKLNYDAWYTLIVKALRHCVQTHPILGPCIWNEGDEKPHFATGPCILLDQQLGHINVDIDWESAAPGSAEALARDDPQNWHETLGLRVLRTELPRRLSMSGNRFTTSWQVGVQELPPGANSKDGELANGADDPSLDRFLITITYSHGLGDGVSGLAFHRTLLEGLNLALADNGAEYPYKFNTTPTEPDQEPEEPRVLQRSDLTPKLPPTIEEAAKLTVSLRYLLAPLLGEKLPGFLARLLGLRATAVPEAGSAWLGREHYFLDKDQHDNSIAVSAEDPPITASVKSTGVVWLRIPGKTVTAVLAQCKARQREARMTGLLHQLVVRALSEILPEKDAHGRAIKSIITQSAVDLRRSVTNLGPDDMALCVTGYYEVFPRDPISTSSLDADAATATTTTDKWKTWTAGDADHPVWAAARETTKGLHRQASTLHNQPVALLRWLSDMRRWTREQVGKRREASYEVSNLTVFDPWARRGVWGGYGGAKQLAVAEQGEREKETAEVLHRLEQETAEQRRERRKKAPFDIEAMVFSQPANAVGGVFDVNVVTVKGGEMAVCFSWQPGALGLGGKEGEGEGEREEEKEEGFMRRVAGSLKSSLEELAAVEAS